MKKFFGESVLRTKLLALLVLAFAATSCFVDDENEMPSPTPGQSAAQKVLVLNEGGFGKANASIDYYYPATKSQRQSVFEHVNGIKLGDVAQSMLLDGNNLYIVVNNSHVIYKLDAKTFKRTNQLNVDNPRYLYMVNDEKAYVSHLGSGDITVINPKTMTEIKKITTYQSAIEGAGMYNLSTEKWLKVDDQHVLVSCWSNHNKVLLIDTTKDEVIKEIEVGSQPNTMGMDKNGKAWVLCEGQPWANDPVEPTLWTIDTKADFVAQQVGDEIPAPPGKPLASPHHLVMNATGDAFYFCNTPHIFKMSINDTEIPATPFLEISTKINTYSFALAPNGDFFLGDAKNYSSLGAVYHYSAEGKLLDSFNAGYLPKEFIFYTKK